MRICSYLILGALCASPGLPGIALAQDATPPETVADATDSAELLTQAELETLMAPVALYPDTLLIQILVAATYPLEIVKSDRFLSDNGDTDPDTLKTAIEAEGWDPSVTVLATAFPAVIGDMAEHVEWTDTVGTAMLAQSEDVLSAVQTLRDQAIETGALISGEAQTVTTDADDNVIVTPTDPEIVYVPQYDPNVVYDDNNLVGDALITGAVAFGTFAVIDAIFDDDDDWDDYWGCRNCGGWGGGPIIHSPDIDIDVDGNVNIGNTINRPNRPDIGENGGWRPEDGRTKDAKDKITAKRDEGGKTKLPIDKAASRPGADRGDDLRTQLSARSGAADIARPDAGGRLPQIDRPAAKRPAADKAAAVKKTAARPAAAKKPAVKKPSTKKVATKAAAPKKTAIKKRAPAGKTKAASNRGKAAKIKARR